MNWKTPTRRQAIALVCIFSNVLALASFGSHLQPRLPFRAIALQVPESWQWPARLGCSMR